MRLRNVGGADDFTRAVRAFTEDLQRQSEPIERVIVQLKRVIAESAAASDYLRQPHGTAHWSEDVTAVAVRCCIKHYFRDSQ